MDTFSCDDENSKHQALSDSLPEAQAGRSPQLYRLAVRLRCSEFVTAG